MKNISKYIMLITPLLIFGGCMSKNNIPIDNNVEKVSVKSESEVKGDWSAIPLEGSADKLITYKYMTIQKGTTLKDLTDLLEKRNYNLIYSKDINLEKYVFEQKLSNLKVDEIIMYLSNKYGDINIEKLSESMYIIKQYKQTEKKEEGFQSFVKFSKLDHKDIKDLLNEKIKLNGEFSMLELIDILKLNKINIYGEFFDKSFNGVYKAGISNFNGTLNELFDLILDKYNMYVYYDEKTRKFRISDLQTEIYDLKLPAVQVAPGADLKGLVTDSIKPFTDLDTEIKKILQNKPNTSSNLNITNGTLMVTTDPMTMRNVEKLLQKFESIYGKSIRLEMHIYEVNLNNKNAFGLDFKDLMKQAVTKFGGGAITFDGASLRGGVPTGAMNTLNFSAKANNDVYGFLLNFMNNYGSATVVNKPILETVNNIPVSMKITNKKDYIKSVTSTSSANVTNGTTVVPGTSSQNIERDTLETGFKLTILPKITGENKIKLALAPEITNLKSLTPYSYGDSTTKNTVQLKDIDTKSFGQVITLKNGETTIIGGYIYNSEDGGKETLPGFGAGSGFFDKILSTTRKTQAKSELVITIKAMIRDE